MRFISILLILFICSSCTKALQEKAREIKKCARSSTGADLNIAGQRLPVAISYRMPNSWLSTGETNSMKFDERIIDPISQAKIKVFYFEGMKDKNKENLERWANQFMDEGRELLSQQVLMINEIPIVEFIMSGTYKHKKKPMDPDSTIDLRPKHTMRAYIVETQTGTWFFKAVAPNDVVEKLAPKFEEMVSTIRESF
jgi:hypothetical protein